MIRLAHAVNPFLAHPNSPHAFAQAVTFETMRTAQAFAVGRAEVELWAALFPEDEKALPAGFQQTAPLTLKAADVGSFTTVRPLPLLCEILERLYEATAADYLIYTNTDIALMPHFYTTTAAFIAEGYDAFVINRRTISDQYHTLEELPLMYAQLGQPHRGWDCFVFHRAAFPRYRIGQALVGAPRVGLVLLANLVAHATRFREFKDEHLTFHLGDDRPWGRGRFADYSEHNTGEALRLMAELEAAEGAFARSSPPGRFLFRRRTFGPLYERLVQLVNLPTPLSHRLRQLRTRRSQDSK